MNIILIGFMAAGKSLVAKTLSKILKYSAIEMDALVFQKTKTKNMHEVFAKGGELLLRETEIAITREIACQSNQVIATGGGVVLNKIILDYFKDKGGRIFFLHTNFNTIAERLKNDQTRPLLQFHDAKTIYDFRLPLYLHYADAIIPIESQSADEIAYKIKGMIQ